MMSSNEKGDTRLFLMLLLLLLEWEIEVAFKLRSARTRDGVVAARIPFTRCE